MRRSRPGKLSVRAINQYRRRDVLCYLALRYYLYNSATREDQWARRIATNLVSTRSSPSYFHASHFKDIDDEGKVEHRSIYLPGANEALAETALLDECSQYPQVFDNPASVYSYRLSKGSDRSGIYQYYINGLRERHDAIAKACDAYPNGVVQYTDIRRFYPSIETSLAAGVWNERCSTAGLSGSFQGLGEKLLSEHGATDPKRDGRLLTGPMLSHLIANLVLRKLDDELATNQPVGYFRYVDDIVLVGEADDVVQSFDTIGSRLTELGLQLHDEASPKNMVVPTRVWLEGRNDYRESRRDVSWLTLIANLKRFLISNPGDREILANAFREEGFRVPIRDYTSAVYEADYLRRVRNWLSNDWFNWKFETASIPTLIDQARQLRENYEAEFRDLLDETVRLEGFDRKRRIPKLRYRGSRLIYLATDEVLSQLAKLADELAELYFHARVMEATASGDVSQILTLGTNAAQATAQPLRAAGKSAIAGFADMGAPGEQAYAVFLLNGVNVEVPHGSIRDEAELVRFAINGADRELMRSDNHFIREIACLHGVAERPRHTELLEAVYDEDEDLALDAISQLQQSFSP